MVDSGNPTSPDSSGDVLARPWLRTGGVLLHIGPAKTGTTALQTALAKARSSLASEGILYPGSRYQHGQAAEAVQQRKSSWGDIYAEADDAEPVSIEPWEDLVAQVQARSDRAIVSAEGFAASDSQTAARIVRDLGDDQVQVLVTMRPISRVAPSIWQQRVKAGETRTYSEWLSATLALPEAREVLQPEILVRRWAEVVGLENIAVLMSAPGSPDQFLRDFEALAGIPAGLLVAGRSNRSMTAEESELVRQLWVRVLEQPENLPQVARQIRRGVSALVETRTPAPDESRLQTPPWARSELTALENASLASLLDTGLLVIGERSAYARDQDPATGRTSIPKALSNKGETASGAQDVGPDTSDAESPSEASTPRVDDEREPQPNGLAVDALHAFVTRAAALDATRLHRIERLRRRRRAQ